MSKYILGSRGRVAGHLPARASAALTLSAGGLVLFRAALLVTALVIGWHYGLLS